MARLADTVPLALDVDGARVYFTALLQQRTAGASRAPTREYPRPRPTTPSSHGAHGKPIHEPVQLLAGLMVVESPDLGQARRHSFAGQRRRSQTHGRR